MEDKIPQTNSEFILFKTEGQKISVDVRFEDETVWLPQDQLSVLFDKAKSKISESIKHLFEEGELDEKWLFGVFELPLKKMQWKGKRKNFIH